MSKYNCGSYSECPSNISGRILQWPNQTNLCYFLGGQPGSRGLNLLLLQNGRIINLGGKSSIPVHPGVSFLFFVCEVNLDCNFIKTFYYFKI